MVPIIPIIVNILLMSEIFILPLPNSVIAIDSKKKYKCTHNKQKIKIFLEYIKLILSDNLTLKKTKLTILKQTLPL